MDEQNNHSVISDFGVLSSALDFAIIVCSICAFKGGPVATFAQSALGCLVDLSSRCSEELDRLHKEVNE